MDSQKLDSLLQYLDTRKLPRTPSPLLGVTIEYKRRELRHELEQLSCTNYDLYGREIPDNMDEIGNPLDDDFYENEGDWFRPW